MSHFPLAPRRNFTGLAVVFAVVLLAVILGLVGAVAGWYAQLLILSIALPFVLLLVDYRLGLALVVLLMPYAMSPLLPKAGPLSVINVLLLGLCLAFVARWTLHRIVGHHVVVPIARELVWFYFVPLTVATFIGTFYLDEVPRHLFASPDDNSYGLKEYWISFYFKAMLLVAVALILGAAVAESGRARRFAVLSVLSGLLLVVGVATVAFLSGVSLDQLRRMRGYLSPLGLHNNDVGIMLVWPFAFAVFMRECSSSTVARIALLAVSLALVAAVLLTFSRGAFVGLVVVTLLYVWHFKRFRVGLSVLTLAVVAVALAPDAVRDRLTTGLDNVPTTGRLADVSGSDEQLTAGRIYIWMNLAPEVLRSPVVGRGMGSGMWSRFVQNGSQFQDPHSLYLRILMDLGIVGAVCIALFYRFVWRLFRQMSTSESLDPVVRGFFMGAAAALLAKLVSGLSGGTYYPWVSELYLWVSIGLALGCRRYLEDQRSLATGAASTDSSQLEFRRGMRMRHTPAVGQR